MKSFEQKLKERKENFENNGSYNQNSMPEIYAYYKEYVTSGQYPYLRLVSDFILTKEIVNPELHKYLETEVYLASEQYHKEQQEIYAKKMISDGWLPLTKSIFLEALNHGQKLEVSAEMQGAILTVKVTHIYKPVIDDNGTYFLMKSRATRKGYPLNNFKNAFCKIIN